MRQDRLRRLGALVGAAGLLCAVLIVAARGAVQSIGGEPGPAVAQSASDSGSLVASPPLKTAHIVAKPVKRLPWGPAEPVLWTALLLAVLTVLTFGTVAAARRALRWRMFVLRAPPISAVG